MSEEERTLCMEIGILQHILIKDQKHLLILRWKTIVAERRAEAAERRAEAARRDADAAKRRADAAKWQTTLSTSDIEKCQRNMLRQLEFATECASHIHWKVYPLVKLMPPEVATTSRSENPKKRYLPAKVMSLSYPSVRELCDEAKLLVSGVFSEAALQATCEHGNLSTSKHVHGSDSLRHLKKLSDVFNNAIEKSKILSPLPHGNEQWREKRYVDAIETFLTRFDDAVSSNSTEQSWFTARNCFPGSVHQENDGVYKVLAHLLRSVGAIMTTTSKPSTSMRARKRKTMNDSHPVTTGVAAAVICMRGPHHALIIRDDAMDIMVRMKAGQGTQRGPLYMIDEQREQLLSHLGDHVERAMDFGGGVGVPTFVTGVIMGLAHVQILQLHLLEVGTPECRLELHATRLLPLMTKENFQRWYKSNILYQKFASEWKELTMLLYPAKDVPIRRTKNSNPAATLDQVLLASSEREFVDNQGILLGWKALLSVMTASAQDLTEEFDKDNGNLGRMIGGGAYANVFRVSSATSVRKVSNYGQNYHIQNEVQYLKKLKSAEKSYPATVSQYEESGDLGIVIGGVKIFVPYLQTMPYGMPLYYYLLGQRRFFRSAGEIGTGMKEALDFIHKHNICHNDVSDRNIVINSGKPVLIDFGNAADIGSDQDGFFGTRAFAPQKIQLDETWVCKKEYDFVGLGFTIATILNEGKMAWSMRRKGDDCSTDFIEDELVVFENRYLEAEKIIKRKEGCGPKHIDMWLGWIALDKVA